MHRTPQYTAQEVYTRLEKAKLNREWDIAIRKDDEKKMAELLAIVGLSKDWTDLPEN
ncbi:MAG: hypothetical protein JJ850_03930 [Kordiimonadaceae bacterium]|nr:hypothetical protein [Kordiimonadaceae bacterium]MBO6568533.1 hypothetical protein [Kordiimonadaceae bacterium]MBO6963738.1 hypothetical protein [Kordiimonadaceae bacterium]